MTLDPFRREAAEYVAAWAGLRDARILTKLPKIAANLEPDWSRASIGPPDPAPIPQPWGWQWNWWTGERTEQAYAALHRADVAYLALAPDATIRGLAASMLNELPNCGWAKIDPRNSPYASTLKSVAFPSSPDPPRGAHLPPDPTPPPPIDDATRTRLQGISQDLNLASTSQHYVARAFRNMLLSIAIGLLVVYMVLAIIGWLQPRFLSLCDMATTPPTCPNASSSPGAGDVFVLGLIGMAGGAVGALTMLLKVQVGGGPFTLPIAQALIKLPAGAVISLIGLFLLQNGTIGIFTPQSGNALVAWAFVFGVAQQTITTTIDKKANALAVGSPASTSGGSPVTPT
jgi:hypothetical protein